MSQVLRANAHRKLQFQATVSLVADPARLLYMYSTSNIGKSDLTMLALRLPLDIEKRLAALAKKTGRSKSFYAREAILQHLEDIEDHYLATKHLARSGKRVSLEQLEGELKDKS